MTGVPTSILDLSSTAASNSPSGSDSIGTSLDDYLRSIQAITRSESKNKSWERWGDTAAYASATTFTISGDVTSRYTVGRRLKCSDSTTLYGVIASSAFSTGTTTVTVTLDSGSLTAALSEVMLGIEANSASIADGYVTTAKLNDAAISGLTAVTIASNDYVAIADTSDSNKKKKALVSDILALSAAISSNGRLTLTSGTPITTTDVASSTNIYFTPYEGNSISLYLGSAWAVRTFSEITIALGTLTSNKNYDLFAYDNAGVVTFDSPVAWTNDTTRATALVLQDGVYVKSGATTRRYIGTFRTISTTTTCDTARQRLLYNALNQVPRKLQRKETTNTWVYTTATIRQANGSATNQVELVDGGGLAFVSVDLRGCVSNNSASTNHVLIGLDSVTTAATDSIGSGHTNPATFLSGMTAKFTGQVGLGFHYLTWLERAEATGSASWYGNGSVGGVAADCGLSGSAVM